jgi:hypothetical protein
MEFNSPVPTPAIPNISKTNSPRIWYLTTALLILLLALSLGWNIYSPRMKSSVNSPLIPSSSASNIFELQNAFITGEITEINGNRITITTKAGKGELRVADNVSISDLNENSATPSSDLKNIKTNKLANINAQVIKDEYQVTTISYIQQSIDLSKIPPVTTPPIPATVSASESAENR